MINSETLERLEKEGESMIVYTMGVDISDNNTVAVTKLNELCELDSGIELLRTAKKYIPILKHHGKTQKFNVVYSTPDCKDIAEKIAKRDKATLIMLF